MQEAEHIVQKLNAHQGMCHSVHVASCKVRVFQIQTNLRAYNLVDYISVMGVVAQSMHA
jgi:hypothetical protein